MTETPTSSPHVRQCWFCNVLNVVSPDDPDGLCANCGLEPAERRELSEIDQSETVEADPSSPANADEEDDAGGETLAKRPGGRRRSVLLLVAGIVVVAGLALVGILIAAGLQPHDRSEGAPSDTTVQLELVGWESSPVWTHDVDVASAAESTDGSVIGVTDGSTARVLDTATGDILATQDLSDDASNVFRIGDMFVVGDDYGAYIWEAPGEGDATSEWRHVALPDDATLRVRGDIAVAVSEVGATYDLITADAELSPVTPPITGAVPVAATRDTILWGTNRHTAYATDHAGEVQSDTTVASPGGDASIDRWVGGDATHVYLTWETGDDIILVVHDIESGEAVSSLPLPETDARPVRLRDGTTTAVGSLLIDATTGAITDAGAPVVAAANRYFVTESDEGFALILPDGEVRELVDQEVTPVAGTAEGGIVAVSDGTLAAFRPSSGVDGHDHETENN